MTTTYQYANTLVVVSCCQCFIDFAMPSEFNRECRNHSSETPGTTMTFYCPRGHAQHYTGKNVEQRLREEVRWQQERLAAKDDMIRSERRAHAATKGQLTRTKKRVAKGVCPCCNRAFTALARHMASQHPDYTEAT